MYTFIKQTKRKNATVQTYIVLLFVLLAVIIEKYTIVIYMDAVIDKSLQVAF